jgi:transcription initiation factor TFIID TATA-box-binding protein
MKYEIVNMVVTADLNQDVDKEMIDDYFGELSEYNPDNFPAVIVSSDEFEGCILLFKDNVVSTGLKDPDNPTDSLDWLSENLPEGIDYENASVKNMVGLADVDIQLSLNSLAIKLGLENIEYEPEIFPALIYRPEGRDYVVNVSNNGKLIINGLTDVEDIKEAVREVEEDLENKDPLKA